MLVKYHRNLIKCMHLISLSSCGVSHKKGAGLISLMVGIGLFGFLIMVVSNTIQSFQTVYTFSTKKIFAVQANQVSINQITSLLERKISSSDFELSECSKSRHYKSVEICRKLSFPVLGGDGYPMPVDITTRCIDNPKGKVYPSDHLETPCEEKCNPNQHSIIEISVLDKKMIQNFGDTKSRITLGQSICLLRNNRVTRLEIGTRGSLSLSVGTKYLGPDKKIDVHNTEYFYVENRF